MSWRAASGLRAWLWQRFSAVYMAVFLVYFLLAISVNSISDYHQWQQWLQQPYNNIGLALFFLATLVHAWVGGRDILMDYVSAFRLRFGLLGLLAVFLLAMGVWVLKILLAV